MPCRNSTQRGDTARGEPGDHDLPQPDPELRRDPDLLHDPALPLPPPLTAHLPDVDPVSPMSGCDISGVLNRKQAMPCGSPRRQAHPRSSGRPRRSSRSPRPPEVSHRQQACSACAPPVAHLARGPLDTTSHPGPVEQETRKHRGLQESKPAPHHVLFVGGPPGSLLFCFLNSTYE